MGRERNLLFFPRLSGVGVGTVTPARRPLLLVPPAGKLQARMKFICVSDTVRPLGVSKGSGPGRAGPGPRWVPPSSGLWPLRVPDLPDFLIYTVPPSPGEGP